MFLTCPPQNGRWFSLLTEGPAAIKALGQNPYAWQGVTVLPRPSWILEVAILPPNPDWTAPTFTPSEAHVISEAARTAYLAMRAEHPAACGKALDKAWAAERQVCLAQEMLFPQLDLAYAAARSAGALGGRPDSVTGQLGLVAPPELHDAIIKAVGAVCGPHR